ncbi:hypothetical protein J8273_7996 [Carpediemonas membranifera]|uniref:Uncharacterized protein n=1 Tax=Carpediemonas membranifera TaxID=201153 RepID=A0A8J6APW9_9EUKA|nr:hypothetical protein J8273_7996 [Carpediemonas membranifera]|eukprot:KAG9390631.1 hypothetical protein J8273_7996 [Carpediemonas membranifera]
MNNVKVDTIAKFATPVSFDVQRGHYLALAGESVAYAMKMKISPATPQSFLLRLAQASHDDNRVKTKTKLFLRQTLHDIVSFSNNRFIAASTDNSLAVFDVGFCPPEEVWAYDRLHHAAVFTSPAPIKFINPLSGSRTRLLIVTDNGTVSTVALPSVMESNTAPIRSKSQIDDLIADSDSVFLDSVVKSVTVTPIGGGDIVVLCLESSVMAFVLPLNGRLQDIHVMRALQGTDKVTSVCLVKGADPTRAGLLLVEDTGDSADLTLHDMTINEDRINVDPIAAALVSIPSDCRPTVVDNFVFLTNSQTQMVSILTVSPDSSSIQSHAEISLGGRVLDFVAVKARPQHKTMIRFGSGEEGPTVGVEVLAMLPDRVIETTLDLITGPTAQTKPSGTSVTDLFGVISSRPMGASVNDLFSMAAGPGPQYPQNPQPHPMPRHPQPMMPHTAQPHPVPQPQVAPAPAPAPVVASPVKQAQPQQQEKKKNVDRETKSTRSDKSDKRRKPRTPAKETPQPVAILANPKRAVSPEPAPRVEPGPKQGAGKVPAKVQKATAESSEIDLDRLSDMVADKIYSKIEGQIQSMFADLFMKKVAPAYETASQIMLDEIKSTVTAATDKLNDALVRPIDQLTPTPTPTPESDLARVNRLLDSDDISGAVMIAMRAADSELNAIIDTITSTVDPEAPADQLKALIANPTDSPDAVAGVSRVLTRLSRTPNDTVAVILICSLLDQWVEDAELPLLSNCRDELIATFGKNGRVNERSEIVRHINTVAKGADSRD